MNARIARHLAVTLALAAAAPAIAADPPPAGGIADLAGPRGLALEGAVGVASGSDGIFCNPGAPAARKRYTLESLLSIDRRGGTTVGKYLGGSVVDALSSPVAVSFAYVRALEGLQTGNLIVGGLSGPVGDKVYLGAQARYLKLGGAESVNAVTADAGLLWEVADYLTVGVAGYNLVPSGHELAAPRGVGAGLAIGSDTSVKLTADWRADFDRLGKTTNRYGAGLEVLLGNLMPLRAGWMKDETLDTSWWSAGAGLVSANGVGLDLGYKQSLKTPDARVVSAAIRVQLLDL
ncbi:MAG TPA: hypothetical protein VFP50_18335 [Anaeromyxobacteraceae bacterium]|nr:hypothetical protein [Anaeromyxobacteraceae bacterium]